MPPAHGGHAALAGHTSGIAHAPAAASHSSLMPEDTSHLSVRVASQPSPLFPASWRLLPSPRSVFSIVALFGAFGWGLSGGAHWPNLAAAPVAALAALLIERFLLSPLWNVLFRFEGMPSSPLESVIMDEAKAVTPFHNGKGIVQVLHDGRLVQLSARLKPEQESLAVAVGDPLRVEEIDSAHERAIVSIR